MPVVQWLLDLKYISIEEILSILSLLFGFAIVEMFDMVWNEFCLFFCIFSKWKVLQKIPLSFFFVKWFKTVFLGP